MARPATRRFLQRALHLGLFASALCATPSLAASPDVAEYKQAVSAGAAKAIQDNIVPRFASTLAPEQVSILRSIDTRIVPNELGLDAVQSSVDARGHRMIEIGDTFMMFDFVFCEDYLIAVHYNKVDHYLQFLSDLYANGKRNADRAKQGLPLENGPAFVTYLGEDPRNVAAVGEQLAGAAQEVFIANLAFIYGHELGHHVHHDLDATPEYAEPDSAAKMLRRREADADQFALHVSLRAGYDVLSAIPTLLFMMEHEHEPAALSLAGHPSAECRFKTITVVGMAQMERDREFPTYVQRAPGGLARWRQTKAALRRLSEGLASQCD